MQPHEHLAWPFFDDAHRELARSVEAWAAQELAPGDDPGDLDGRCRRHVRALGDAGWLRHVVPAAYGGARERVDVRSLCVIRETLARHDPLAEFCFALQGLGTGPVSLYGTEALRARYLPDVAAGRRIAAFALSEQNAGSDVSAMSTTARRDGSAYVIDG